MGAWVFIWTRNGEQESQSGEDLCFCDGILKEGIVLSKKIP